MNHTSTIAALCLLASACGTASLDPCESIADPVSLEASTEAGSAGGLLDLVQGTEERVLSGPAFGSVGMRLSVAWTGQTAAWEEHPPDAQAHVCANQLRVPVDVNLVTDDGALDEQWTVEAIASEPGVAVVTHEVSVDGLRGRWQPQVDEMTDLRLRVRIQWTEDGSEGVLSAVGSPVDGGPDESWDVAVWPG